MSSIDANSGDIEIHRRIFEQSSDGRKGGRDSLPPAVTWLFGCYKLD